MAEDFRDADDGQVFGIDDSIAADGTHAVATHTEEFKRRITASQSLDKLRAVHFAGRLTGGDQDSHTEGIVTSCHPERAADIREVNIWPSRRAL
jgi:hypothetical protein